MSGYTFRLEPVDVPRIETRHRRIVTPIPAPGSIPILRELSRYEPGSLHHELPVVWDRAEGYQVFDAYGKAKRMAYADMRGKWYLRTMPWFAQELEATNKLMGENFFPYGIAPNRKVRTAVQKSATGAAG